MGNSQHLTAPSFCRAWRGGGRGEQNAPLGRGVIGGRDRGDAILRSDGIQRAASPSQGEARVGENRRVDRSYRTQAPLHLRGARGHHRPVWRTGGVFDPDRHFSKHQYPGSQRGVDLQRPPAERHVRPRHQFLWNAISPPRSPTSSTSNRSR